MDAAGVIHPQAIGQVAIMIGADPDLEFIDPGDCFEPPISVSRKHHPSLASPHFGFDCLFARFRSVF